MHTTPPSRPVWAHRNPCWACVGLLLVALAGLVAGPRDAVGGEGENPDLLVLPGGERLDCRILGAEAGWLTVRIGNRSYRFERSRLEGVLRAGEPELDEDLMGAVTEWGEQLASPNEATQRGARAALATLGASGPQYMRAAAELVSQGPAAAELRRLAIQAAERGRQVRLAAMQRAIAMRPLQEGAFAPAAMQFLEACDGGTDRQQARDVLEEALADVLDEAQRVALGSWLDETTPEERDADENGATR